MYFHSNLSGKFMGLDLNLVTGSNRSLFANCAYILFQFFLFSKVLFQEVEN